MRPSRKQKNPAWRTVAGVAFLAALLAGWGGGTVPLPVLAGYGAMSLAAFVLYRHDKRAAQGGKARTRERTLHLLGLLGGWPGGLLAQDRLGHKTRKAAFQLVFWATVALNCAALGWLLGAAGPHVRP
ncbi:MAG: DUF1294 domain-containing protein [Gemmatimonadota bacterium]